MYQADLYFSTNQLTGGFALSPRTQDQDGSHYVNDEGIPGYGFMDYFVDSSYGMTTV